MTVTTSRSPRYNSLSAISNQLSCYGSLPDNQNAEGHSSTRLSMLGCRPRAPLHVGYQEGLASNRPG